MENTEIYLVLLRNQEILLITEGEDQMLHLPKISVSDDDLIKIELFIMKYVKDIYEIECEFLPFRMNFLSGKAKTKAVVYMLTTLNDTKKKIQKGDSPVQYVWSEDFRGKKLNKDTKKVIKSVERFFAFDLWMKRKEKEENTKASILIQLGTILVAILCCVVPIFWIRVLTAAILLILLIVEPATQYIRQILDKHRNKKREAKENKSADNNITIEVSQNHYSV